MFYVLSLVVVLSMLMAACQPAATATEAPAPQQPAAPTDAPAMPAPTEAPAEPAEPVESPTEAMPAGETAAPAGDFTPMSLAAPDCSYGGEFQSIEAIDAQTVKFTLCYPDPAFPSKVAFNVFSIADADYLDVTGGESIQMSDEANGTGPFLLQNWTRGDSITFERNPEYWGTQPAIDTLIFRWSEQSAQRLLELQSGTVDGIDNPQPEDFESIESDANLALIPRDALNIFYIGFQRDLPPFDNEEVRQALAMGIDRQRIVDEFYAEGSRVADVFVPPAMKPGYSENVPWYDYDQEAARQALEDAGFDFNQEITLYFRNVVRNYLPTPDKVAQEIQAQLAEIGVKVRLEQQESTTFIDNSSAGQLGMYLLGWGADYPDATNFYDYHFATEQNMQFGSLFPDIVEPIRQAGQVADPAARQELYDEVNTLLKQHVPMIPVAHGSSAVAFQANVENAMTGPLQNEPFYLMDPGKDTLVWLQNGEPAALWCSDETDGESLRACQQIYEPLLNFRPGSVEVEPWLAESFEANDEATEYTFVLRQGVKFHNGADLDANDVVASFTSLWDASSPNHQGRTGTFEYFGAFFGSFLNAP
jgi:peptide/nickel transport system substrate-binding protein